MENLHNINIERAVLSSVFFNPALFEEVASRLKPSDFYLPAHRYIFEAMEACEREELPIDEDFVRQKMGQKFDENVMLENIATNPLPSVNAYASEIKEKFIKREIKKTMGGGLDYAQTSTSILANLQKKLDELQNKTIGKNDLKCMLTAQEGEVEWFTPDIVPIPRRAVTLLNASGGSGKTQSVIVLMLHFLAQNPEKKAFAWLSEDPSFLLKKRVKEALKIYNFDEKILERFNFWDSSRQIFHFCDFGKNITVADEFIQFKKKLSEFDFVVLDPLIAFFGGDENSNSHARFFMSHLSTWAELENKAIVVLTHTAKGEKNTGTRGAGGFKDACRLEYIIQPVEKDPRMRIFKIGKDNWYAQGVAKKDELKIQIWRKKIEVEVVEYQEAQISQPDFSSIPKLGGKK
jgi:replicative DNA helicase